MLLKDNPTQDSDARAIAELAAYCTLIRERSCWGWSLTVIILAAYFAYILLVAFAPHWLSRPISNGVTTVGIDR